MIDKNGCCSLCGKFCKNEPHHEGLMSGKMLCNTCFRFMQVKHGLKDYNLESPVQKEQRFNKIRKEIRRGDIVT